MIIIGWRRLISARRWEDQLVYWSNRINTVKIGFGLPEFFYQQRRTLLSAEVLSHVITEKYVF